MCLKFCQDQSSFQQRITGLLSTYLGTQMKEAKPLDNVEKRQKKNDVKYWWQRKLANKKRIRKEQKQYCNKLLKWWFCRRKLVNREMGSMLKNLAAIEESYELIRCIQSIRRSPLGMQLFYQCVWIKELSRQPWKSLLCNHIAEGKESESALRWCLFCFWVIS